MMHEVASHGGGMSATSAVHINLFGPHPIVVKGTPEQKARWVPRLVAGEDQCCFGFTEPDAGLNTTRDQDLRAEGAGRLPRPRPEGLDLDRAGRQQDHAADANDQIRGLRAADRRHHDLLHRPRPLQDRRSPHSENGPQGGRFQRHLHRRSVHSGLRPHRRGGQGLFIYPAQPQSRAHPDRSRSDWDRSGCAAPRGKIRARARRVRPSDRAESGYPASARRELDVSGVGLADGDARRLALRSRQGPAAPKPTPPNSSAPAPVTTLRGRRS